MFKKSAFLLCFLVAGCTDQTVFQEKSFLSLSGWSVLEAESLHKTFLKTCERWEISPPKPHKNPLFGSVEDWQNLCTRAGQVEVGDVRHFYELNFKIYQLTQPTPWWQFWKKPAGLFTGYYQPQLKASFEREGPYQTPLFNIPENLITADLGAFTPNLTGQKIVGQVVGKNFVPYATRAQIFQKTAQEIADQTETMFAHPVAWVEDDVDVFFLHIQGSGELVFPSGQVLQVGYAGHNGHTYKAIGKTLKEMGVFAEGEEITMQKIRTWLHKNPTQKQEVLNTNPRYIFFKLTDEGPKGAQGVVLTPERSLAVDTSFIPLGTPVFVHTKVQGQKFNKAMVAQDVGAAITGQVRGDIFFGKGEKAEVLAGAQNAPGELFVFAPAL